MSGKRRAPTQPNVSIRHHRKSVATHIPNPSGARTKSRAKTTKGKWTRDPDEVQIAKDYEGIPLSGLEIVYDEAKYAFAEQDKSVQAMNTRSTWVAATAGGVLLGVLPQVRNLFNSHPTTLAILAFILGVYLDVLALLGAIQAALLDEYSTSLKIEELRTTYPAWNPKHARISWLLTWQDMYEKNEKVLHRRGLFIQWSFRLLVGGIIFLLIAGALMIRESQI